MKLRLIALGLGLTLTGVANQALANMRPASHTATISIPAVAAVTQYAIPSDRLPYFSERTARLDTTRSLNESGGLRWYRTTHRDLTGLIRMVNQRPGESTYDRVGFNARVLKDDSGGQAGILIAEYQNSGHFQGLLVTHTQNYKYQLPTSGTYVGGGGIHYRVELYAPTSKTPRGCYETGMAYDGTDAPGAHQRFYVYDFCGGGFIVSKYLGSPFKDIYARPDPQTGASTISIQEYSLPPHSYPCNQQAPYQCDVVAIYNYNGNYWDVQAYRIEGDTHGWTQGWSIFETHFHAGACPLPMDYSGSRHIQPVIINSNGGRLAVNADPTNSMPYLYGDCMNTNPPPVRPYYYFYYENPNDYTAWGAYQLN
jgi:hypothetical protein